MVLASVPFVITPSLLQWLNFDMRKRALIVIKEVGSTASVGVCGFCGRQFTVAAPTSMSTDENLHEQFGKHVCLKHHTL
jgi:hypothetical protein